MIIYFYIKLFLIKKMEAKYILLLIIILSSLLLLDCNISSKQKISNKLNDMNDTINNNQKIKQKKNTDKSRRRQLQYDEEEYWEQLNILIDLTNFNATIPDGLEDKKDIFIDAINKAKDTLESFIKIYNYGIRPTTSNEDKTNWGLQEWDTHYFNINFNFAFNYAIFFRFSSLNEGYMATSKIVLTDAIGTPLMGVITIKEDFPDEKINPDFLEALMLHEFTHLLGFHLDVEDVFSGIIEEDSDDPSKYYIKSPKVVEYAKKYFECDDANEIKKIEYIIDDYGNPHWPSRFFLGEYMTKFNYLEEQVISGFTLAFFEDLGFLRVDDYYTGGLMRFGKNRGCNFLKNKCIEDGETYKNEFYFPGEDASGTSDPVPSCSSGRLSRTIYKLEVYGSALDEKYRYFTDTKVGGSPIADYCPISLYPSATPLFSGRCSSKGVIDDDTLSSKIGESLSDRSFCALSSMVKDADSDLANDVRAVCFEMYCSDESLTIKFGTNDFFLCPREGGKIQGFQGFQGFILCPDYNLICTGLGTQTQTDICNDMFDCITKKVKEKEIYYNYYNYDIQTTQDPSEYNDLDYPISKRGELSTNKNTCPQFCSHCDTNKICKKCAANYKLENYKCIEKIPHCAEYDNDNDEICSACKDNYVFVEGDYSQCKSKVELGKKYIPESSGSQNYVKCSVKISQCNECNSVSYCISCFENYGIADSGHTQCVDISQNNY